MAQGPLQWSLCATNSTGGTFTVAEFDANGDLFVAGAAGPNVLDIDPGPGIHDIASLGNADLMLIKYADNGNVLWAHTIGGEESEYIHAMCPMAMAVSTFPGNSIIHSTLIPGPVNSCFPTTSPSPAPM